MNKLRKQNTIVLIILALVFIFPGVAAYLFYTHPQWLQEYRLNKGALLNPPELFKEAPKPQKWRLILWNPGDCKRKCLLQIDKLARIRLALGRRLLKVDELIIMNSQNQLPATLNERLREQDIHLFLLTKEQQAQQKLFDKRRRIFIANPNNYLVLAYKTSAKAGDIFFDIQQLLNINEKAGNV